MSNLKPYLQQLRIKQWIKNAFVFLPLFFSGSLFETDALLKTIIAFFCFCFASSAIYCLNDIKDINDDRNHLVKRLRPLAAGKIGIKSAVILLIFLSLCAIATSFVLLNPACAAIIVLYILLNIAYSFKLKQIPIVDIFIIAFGFVLRIFIDGMACDIYLSPWLVSMTFVLALFLGAAKRYDDVVLQKQGIDIKRKVLSNYSKFFLSQIVSLLAIVVFICYLMYTLSADVVSRIGCDEIYITSVFVLFGLMRYLQITFVRNKSGDPTSVVVNDIYIIFTLLGWLLSFFYFIYFYQ